MNQTLYGLSTLQWAPLLRGPQDNNQRIIVYRRISVETSFIAYIPSEGLPGNSLYSVHPFERTTCKMTGDYCTQVESPFHSVHPFWTDCLETHLTVCTPIGEKAIALLDTSKSVDAGSTLVVKPSGRVYPTPQKRNIRSVPEAHKMDQNSPHNF